MKKYLEFQSTLYKRKLLIELYSPQKFISPRVYIRENDISVISYDLVVSPSTSNATIGISSRAVGEPIKIENAEQMRNVFDDL